eukprot:TRINITY_DN2540_c0_g1_i1.p1 TRINITY_DN2540_c0_g1~~TRINITY_DN2540_c0_g1_i1.p1  ORF type:complete len:309 (-),score=41.19 TRINITY_DN2540_c0_g1_i1:874-1755(-)
MEQPVLLFGSTGYVGGNTMKHLQEMGIPVVAAKSRIENLPDVQQEIKQVNPRYVIHAAGVVGSPNIDWCETHREVTTLVNIGGTINVVEAARQCGKGVTIFGSGCIYEYDAAHAVGSGIGFTEEEKPNFRGSFYVRMRIALEDILETFNNVLMLRVRLPISADMHPRSVLSKLLQYQRVVNVPNSITNLDDLLPIAIKASEKGLRGIYNFCNPGVISHNELLGMWKQYIDPQFTWVNFSLEEQAQVLQAGRSNNELNVSKLVAEFPEILPIQESLRNLFLRMKAAGVQPVQRS